MKSVDQQFVDDQRGDCLRACVASVLEVSLEEVPDLASQGFLPALVRWGTERGLHVIWMDIPDFTSLDRIWFGNAPPFFIAWGESPRQTAEGRPKQHAVVVAPKGYGVKVAHDPHESRDGLKTMCGFAMILKDRAWRVDRGGGK